MKIPVKFFEILWPICTALVLILRAWGAGAEERHGIAMYGAPALPPDFVSLPYVNADAAKGGSIVLGNTGGFNSLNPFVLKGTVPWQLSVFTHESLMGRSQDEPFALYGLLAESVETTEDRSGVEFTLSKDTRFYDGSPDTVEEVIWSYEVLGTEGHPRYHALWAQIESIEAVGPRSVRLTFSSDNRELALLAGLRPILKKAQWADKSFADAPLSEIPIGSGPYTITDFEAGRFVQLQRNPDYWGTDVPVRRGTHNLDAIRLDFYADADVLLEAFKAGAVSAVREFNVETWNSQYNFPRVETGEVIKTEVPHQKPSGMTGFAMNTRRPPFDDWRVREALLQAFNFEYINDTLTGGAQSRITSYFSNSVLAMQEGPASGRVAALLAPFAEALLPKTLDGYTLPLSDGSLRNRKGLRRATLLLKEAGWAADEGVLRNADGTAFEMEILLPQGSTEYRAIADIYIQTLERLGIAATVSLVDDAQFTSRTGNFDFDLAYYRRALSLSPGTEQRLYWGSASADEPGSRNLMGVKSTAVDAMIDEMLRAKTPDDFRAATRALDRVMTAGRYVIPFWQFTSGRIAHVAQMRHPGTWPIYGDGPNYMPEVWWWED